LGFRCRFLSIVKNRNTFRGRIIGDVSSSRPLRSRSETIAAFFSLRFKLTDHRLKQPIHHVGKVETPTKPHNGNS